MANSEEQQSVNGGRRIDDVDRTDQISGGGDSVSVPSEGVAETSETASQSVTRRLTEIFVGDGDVDLLLQRSDRDGGFLPWLRAMDMQVMGACRADERLKPLLKLNVSPGVAEDGLLAHLSQHFEPSEVGLLARCLCVPLISIRVGKINKQGTLLSPTSVRGNLCLTLLPTSDLRISFNGDDGSVERLITLSTGMQCTSVEIEEIPADISGRSFILKTSDSAFSYFWCSEKSKLLGDELLGKMKGLLMRKPSLAELTGISSSRLNYFASHLRAYLTDTVLSNAQAAGILSSNPSDGSTYSFVSHSSQSSFNLPKSSCSKMNLIYLGRLSPRPSSFKDGLQKSLASLRTAAREKLRRRGENFVLDPSSSTSKDKLSETASSNTPTFTALNFLDVIGKTAELPILGSEIKVPSSGPSPSSPQYCWCPIGNAPISSSGPISLPPLSSLLSSSSKPLLNFLELPPLDFPSFLPDPVMRPPTSQQFPTLMCDPIVHIPVINVCSSGQGYLVTSIAPLVDPLLPNRESAVEKGARETLRMLINNQANDGQNMIDISNSMSSVGLVMLSEKSMGKMCGGGGDDLIDQKEKPSASSGSSGFDEGVG